MYAKTELPHSGWKLSTDRIRHIQVQRGLARTLSSPEAPRSRSKFSFGGYYCCSIQTGRVIIIISCVVTEQGPSGNSAPSQKSLYLLGEKENLVYSTILYTNGPQSSQQFSVFLELNFLYWEQLYLLSMETVE